jgi:hypothetical protein
MKGNLAQAFRGGNPKAMSGARNAAKRGFGTTSRAESAAVA